MVTVKSPAKEEPIEAPQTLPAGPATSTLNTEIEFTLPNGKRIKMGKPAIPSQLLLPTLLAAPEFNPVTYIANQQLITRILYVREIDGKPTPTVENYGQVQQIALQLGEDGMSAVEYIYNKQFPGLDFDQLQIIKK